MRTISVSRRTATSGLGGVSALWRWGAGGKLAAGAFVVVAAVAAALGWAGGGLSAAFVPLDIGAVLGALLVGELTGRPWLGRLLALLLGVALLVIALRAWPTP
ncbi:MAG: hypothetical protein ACRD2E_12230 [Terriglobales bacterium]